MTSIPVFDGHNDVLLRLVQKADRKAAVFGFIEGGLDTHIDLPRARAGGLAGGLFALFSPISYREGAVNGVSRDSARADMFAELSMLLEIERVSHGAVTVCRSTGDLRAAIAADALAVVVHMEGAEAIDPELEALHVFHAAGLRSLGPVWSRDNAFGHGVPMKIGCGPDTGPGLTDAGKALVQTCNQLGIMIDLSHLNEQGFWDVARLSERPLVATHSNAFALCNHSRNLTDRQLDAIRESGGLVGVNYGTGMLRPDGIKTGDTSLEIIVRHVDYMLEKLGPGGVALGSDFDGTVVPDALKDVAGLPALVEAFRRNGYDGALLRRLCMENWLDVLDRTWL